jgi:hypothetical protein
MPWLATDHGSTIGSLGPQSGLIERDEEHTDGARITLEHDRTGLRFAITCGVYGWMFHTRFLGSIEEAEQAYLAMKIGLVRILEMNPLATDPGMDAKIELVISELQDFVDRFP